MKNLISFIAAFFVFIPILVAQGFDWSAQISGTAIFSSEDEIPFWLYSNSSGSLTSESNFSSTAGLKLKYKFKSSFIEAGAAFFYRDGRSGLDEFQRRDLFARFQNNWLKVTAGAKAQEVELHGLSATNKNFVNSGNARPLPGLIIEASNPLKISKALGLDWGIAHYSLNDTRAVDNAYVHYKRLGLKWQINENNSVYGRLQHFAQWGGTSQIDGKQPTGFKDFVDVFVAKHTGDRANALGNHLGTYFLEYKLKTNVGTFSAYRDHPFEDGSGTRFANFPDGIWGITYEPKSESIINTVLYEYIDTSDQSVGGTGFCCDSYFNNRIYSSGWTYDGQTIGLPFIMPPVNNVVKAHQLGIAGTVKQVDITFKTSFVESSGTLSIPFDSKQQSVYTALRGDYDFKKFGKLSLFFGYDKNDSKEDVFGSGITYQYTFQ